MREHDVYLVSMPFSSLSEPSMALGLLTASLRDAGIPVRALYPCIWFAEDVGLDVYAAIYGSKQEFLIGEWVFSRAAFPALDTDDDEYLERVLSAPVSRGLLQRSHFAGDPRAALLAAREVAASFVARVAARVLEGEPGLVGCTSTFAQHCASLALLRAIKELAPEVVTVMGGANCEAAMGVTTVKNFPWVDFVVSGEADLLFPHLCRRVLENGREASLSDLHGVLHARHSSVLFGSTPPRASIDRMDSVPIPDFDDFFSTLTQSRLRDFIAPALALETSRGCWWGQKHHCTFCGLNGSNMTFRSKSAERVAGELDYLSQRHQLRKFNIVDNILDLRYIEDLLPRLPGAEPYTLFYETKSNLRRDQMKKLAQAGIRKLQPGVESMHDEILRLIDKGTTALQNVQLLVWARELGVFIAWNLLWDVPGEQDAWYAEMAEWLPLISHLQPPGVDRIQFHRFSPYHERPDAWGLHLSPCTAYRYVYPLAPDQLAHLAYYFDDPVRRTTREELEKRPGLERALTVVGRWILLWGGAESGSNRAKPLLLMRDDGEAIHIQDTRPCGEGDQILRDLAASVYRACDRVSSLSSLSQAVRGVHPTASDEQIAAAIDDLERRKLILRQNGKSLGLALRQVSTISDRPEDSPGGHVDMETWRAAMSQRPRGP
jgi:ribosomal peptide maturation radical SAM protein 1